MFEKKQELESLVLSSLILLGNEGSSINKQMKSLDVDYFSHKKEKDIFKHIKSEYDESSSVNIIGLDHKFPEYAIMELAAFVAMDSFASTAMLDKYISDLILAYKELQVMDLSERLMTNENIQDKKTMIEDAMEKLNLNEKNFKLKTMQEIITQCNEEVVKIPCHYKKIDNHLKGGFEKRRLYTVAGRPGTGKSTFLLNLAYNFAMTGSRVLFVTLEMPDSEMVTRLAMRATVGRSTLDMKDRYDWLQNDEKYKKLLENMTITEYGNNAHTLRSIAEDYDVICIDQLSFMRTIKKFDNKSQEVSSIVHEMKEFALKEEKVVILASQLNRQASANGESPRLHHLKESGGIEEASDAVFLLSHNEEEQVMAVDIAKNRSGTIGTTFFSAQFSSMMFKEVQDYTPAAPNHETSRLSDVFG